MNQNVWFRETMCIVDPMPRSAPDLRGLWIPIVTPLDADGDVDVDALDRLARRLLADGAAGLVALGTTGEPATLDAAERRSVVEVCDRACREAGRSLLVGAGTNSTRGTIDEIAHLTAGTDAVAALVVAPYYTRPSEQAVVEHYAEVGAASPVPIVAYNVPFRTGRGLGSAALLAIAADPHVVGLKQAVGALDVDTLQVLAGTAGSDFAVLAGDDAFIVPTCLLGAAGAIAAAAHLATPQFVEMTACALRGDVSRAGELATTLLPVVTAGFSEPSPAVWKGALAAQGELATGNLRRPMTSASPEAVDAVLAAVATATA